MADQLVYFENSSDGTPRTGLTPTWEALLKVSDGTAFTPQPVFTEVGAGFYKFPGVVSENVCGSIDGGSALPAIDRYIRDIAMGPVDGYLDTVIADTNDIQSRLPAALVGGKMDSTLSIASAAYNVTITLLNATGTAKAITGATKAANCELTIVGHGYANGTKVVLTSFPAGSMVELNNRLVTLTSTGVNTVTIGVDSTGFTTYTSGGTITKTDEAAIQSAHLSIMDATDTNLYATAETNASGVSVQGSNAYVAMDSGDYVLRPTRSLMNATGSYAFTVSATGTKYFVATALTIPAINTPGTQTLIISAKELGAPWAVGDAVVITPARKQVVGSAVLSTSPISAVVAANGLAQQTVGVDGIAVDIGAIITVKVGDYYTKTITVDSTPVKNILSYA